MSEFSDMQPRPCSVCAALVGNENMQDHLEWHDSMLRRTGDPTAAEGPLTERQPGAPRQPSAGSHEADPDDTAREG
jgi:hypothetical protein